MILDKQLYEKLCNYCAYQERCANDVRQKLFKLKVPKNEHSAYLQKLQHGNFLNEDRYTKFFVAARVKKKWGKQKIQAALVVKKIETPTIKKYIQDIDETEYKSQMNNVAIKKWSTIKAETMSERKTKLLRFLLSKGYEMNFAKAVANELAIGE